MLKLSGMHCLDVKLSTPVVGKIPATPLVEYPVTSDSRTEFVTGSHEKQPAIPPESATPDLTPTQEAAALGIGPVLAVRGGGTALHCSTAFNSTG